MKRLLFPGIGGGGENSHFNSRMDDLTTSVIGEMFLDSGQYIVSQIGGLAMQTTRIIELRSELFRSECEAQSSVLILESVEYRDFVHGQSVVYEKPMQ